MLMTKTYNLAEFNIIKFLDEVKEFDQALRDLIVSCPHKDGVLTVHINGALTAQQETDLQTLVDEHDSTPTSPFRIMELINNDFKGLPLENIDFKHHAKRDIALNKHVVMLPNGRPDKSEYFYNGDLVAEIRFSFQDQNYLMTEKKLHLYYVREDGTYSEPILIKHKIYDHTDLKDGSDAVKERIDAREEIVAGMKAFLSGVLMQALNQTIDQVIITITPFWDETKANRDKFIEFGTDEWKNQITVIDLGSTPHTYLAIPINQEGTTVKDYLIGSLNY